MKGKRLWLLAALLILAGSFFLGVGFAGFWGRELGDGEWQRAAASFGTASGGTEDIWIGVPAEDPYERDRLNALLAENMGFVTMERELVFEAGNRPGYAGIANGPDSRLGCRVTLIRDGTGEILYQSRLIDPGHYIEEIELNTKLRKGYYPCTAVWSFYEGGTDGLVGNTAGKTVVIVKQ